MKRFFAVLLAILHLPSLSFRATPVCNAKAAIVIEASTGAILYEKNADLLLPEASTTKIMTALLTLERADPSEEFTVSPRAAATEGSQLGLAEGDRLSVRDLLYILMLKSGNDAAVALAEGICGTVERFVDAMNQKAEELGLSSTHFQNPHGLPDQGHETTARDLAELTAVAMENAVFAELVATKKATLTYKRMVLENSNKLLWSYDGVVGVKTGFTKAAGRCLVSAAEREGIRLICVTLNDPDDWRDHAALYDTCFSRIGRKIWLQAGEYRGQVPTLDGESWVTVTNAAPVTRIVIDGIPQGGTLVQETMPRTFAPVPQGRGMGRLLLRSERGRTICAVPLEAAARVEQKKEERTLFGSFLLKLRKLWRALISKTVF